MPWPQVRRRTKHTAVRRSVHSHCPRALSFAPKTALSGRVFAALKAINGVVEKIKTCGECVTRGRPHPHHRINIMHCANFPRHLGRLINRCLIAHPNGMDAVGLKARANGEGFTTLEKWLGEFVRCSCTVITPIRWSCCRGGYRHK